MYFTPQFIDQLNELSAPKKSAGNGIFYTPPTTAHQLVRETLLAWLKYHHFLPSNALTLHAADIPVSKRPAARRALAQITVCDPACGVGGLLVPCWLELAELRYTLEPTRPYGTLLAEILQHNLYAADIRPEALEDLRLRLSLTLAAYAQPLPEKLPFFAHNSLTVHWPALCPEVFARDGFDIYLANPPYLGQKNHKPLFDFLRQQSHRASWITPKNDLLYLFFYLAFELIRPTGVAGLLTTAYFAQAAGALPVRRRLKEQATILRLIDFGETKLFQRAKGQHNLITVFAKGKSCPGAGGAAAPNVLQPADLFFGNFDKSDAKSPVNKKKN